MQEHVNRTPQPFGRWLVFALTLLVSSSVSAQQPGAGIFALQSMLEDKSSEIRMKAAEGLARVGGRRAVMILRRGLSDSRTEVRIAVAEALGYVGGRLALTVLSEARKDKAPEVRKRAVEALKDAGTISAIPIIQKAFGDKNAGVRLHAALMLPKIGNRRGVPVLGEVVLSRHGSCGPLRRRPDTGQHWREGLPRRVISGPGGRGRCLTLRPCAGCRISRIPAVAVGHPGFAAGLG